MSTDELDAVRDALAYWQGVVAQVSGEVEIIHIATLHALAQWQKRGHSDGCLCQHCPNYRAFRNATDRLLKILEAHPVVVGDGKEA